MEDIRRTMALTAIAPVAWGSSYYVVQHLLPPDRPLFGAAARALPAALILLALTRTLPSGSWWWRSLVLGTLNIGAFFVLIFVAAERLPGGVAATMMASSPIVLMVTSALLIGEKLRLLGVVGGLLGLVGVGLLVADGSGGIDPVGVTASLTAMLMSSLGFVLGKRWSPPVGLLTFTSWQLLAGSLVLVPAALLIEGPPPALDAGAILGFAWTSVVATAVAYAVWFTGLQRLETGTVGLVGLLNPVTGVLLGVTLAGEHFGPLQILGMVLVVAGIEVGRRTRLPRWRARGIPTRGRGAPTIAHEEACVG